MEWIEKQPVQKIEILRSSFAILYIDLDAIIWRKKETFFVIENNNDKAKG